MFPWRYLGGTGRFGFGQEFELVQILQSETAFSATSASNYTDQALIFGVAPRGCVWVLAAYPSILICAEDEDALLIRPRSGKSVRSIPSKISCWIGPEQPNRARVEADFMSGIKLVWAVSSPCTNILIAENQKSCLPWRRPVPQRGVAQRHQRGAGCGGRFGDARRALPEADGKGVWS